LDAWRETPYYTARERAALEWTESLTMVAQTHVPDEVYDAVKKEFTQAELVDLTYAIIAINGWNRLAISTRAVPGNYQPAQKKATVST
jgi:alkylhydroperoxidase family enzyme